MKYKALILTFLLVAVSLSAQKKDSLALLPFTGGNEGEGDYIVSEFARQRELRSAFNKVTLVTKTTQGFINFEHKFQRDSGLTDADTIFELGKRLNAEYVISGYITELGGQNLVIVSILSVESLQLVAGDYRVFTSIEEIDPLIPDMARALAAGARRNTSGLPGLSVPPFEVTQQVNAADAQVLAQILAICVANGEKYAVLPRTDSLDMVLDEHQRQRTGETDQERVKRLGAGRNAEYVLAGSVGRLGSLTKFTADVLNIEDGSFMDGYSERYIDFTDGVDLMPELAQNLNAAEYIAPSSSVVTGGAPPGSKAAQQPTATPQPPAAPPPVAEVKPPAPKGLTAMVWVPAGTFTMGSPPNERGHYDNEGPTHTVTIREGFYIGAYEVTQKEWKAVMGTTVKDMGKRDSPYGEGDSYPMYNVSWYDAVAYCNALSKKEGLTPAYTINGTTVRWNRNADGYRLPTEAEWEYACRAGTTTPYFSGDSVDNAAWHYGNSSNSTHPVGQKTANRFGLYDTHGNVWEWCWDRYDAYSGESQADPEGASSGSRRVTRGGGWRSIAILARSAYRNRSSPSDRSGVIGFRVARSGRP
jgi:formylglycine-generating enzyme required for sulfatase activity/TolB-like protein